MGHQLGFSSTETIRTKQKFDKLALEHGDLMENYLTENEVFKVSKFSQHLQYHNQRVQYYRVNAHHKNSVAERSIRTLSEMERAMMTHASL